MSSPAAGRIGRSPSEGLSLAYPMSLAIYEKYEDAQRVVDHLADEQFAVQNCQIVGTDLKQVERITGRLTWGKVAAMGIVSGIWLGLFVGLIFALFGDENFWAVVLSTAAFGALFGLIWALIGYGMSGGRRDFTSVTAVVATRYEVLVEHKLAEQARSILAAMPNAPATFAG